MSLSNTSRLIDALRDDCPTMTIEALAVLIYIARQDPDGGCLQHHIVTDLEVPTSTVSRNVSLLSEWSAHKNAGMGLVSSHIHPENRRHRAVRLTHLGRSLFAPLRLRTEMRGIRKRGAHSLMIDIYRAGVRTTETLRREAGETEVAFQRRAEARREALIGDHTVPPPPPTSPPTSTRWTLGDALDFTCRLASTEGGWRGARSEATLIRNGADVVTLLGPTTHLDTIDAETVRSLRSTLLAQGLALPTVNRKVAALSKLMTVAAERPRQSGLTSRPHFPASLDESGSRRTHVITAAEAAALVHGLDRIGETDAADVVRILFATGMRTSEAWALRRRHADVVTHTLTITGPDDRGTKNGAWRTIPMSDEVARILTSRAARPDDLLLPFNNDWLRPRWAKGLVAAGLAKTRDMVPHGARHAFITRALEAGHDAALVRRWVGHSSQTITDRYSHLGTQALQQLLPPPSDETSQGGVVAKLLQNAVREGADHATLMRLVDLL